MVRWKCSGNIFKILFSSLSLSTPWKHPLSPLFKYQPLKLHLHRFSGFSHSLDSGDFCYGDIKASVTPVRPLFSILPITQILRDKAEPGVYLGKGAVNIMSSSALTIVVLKVICLRSGSPRQRWAR